MAENEDQVAKPQVEGEGEQLLIKKKKKDKSASAAAADDGEDKVLDFSKKKKKKKKVREDDGGEGEGPSTEQGAEGSKEGKYPWSGSNRPYEYKELLTRFYDLLHKNNPDLGGGFAKNIFVFPDVQRDGAKKSMYANFQKTCQQLKRDPNHFMQFFLTELATTGNFDAQGRLIIRGRFNQSQSTKVLKQYIFEFVLCDSCKSSETVLVRDQERRMTFLKCQRCGADRTVGAIKAGVNVKVTKRQK